MDGMTPYPKAGTLRTFVAMHLTDDVRRSVRDLQDQLRKELAISGVKWTRIEQVHLTLKFLGSVDDTATEGLTAALRRACVGQEMFRFRLERLGGFPDLRFPRIVWLGVSGETERLDSLQAQIERETAPFSSHTEQRPFHPHLTLARVKQVSPSERSHLEQLLKARQLSALGNWTVREVVLMKSVLASEGPTYTPLAVIPLAATCQAPG